MSTVTQPLPRLTGPRPDPHDAGLRVLLRRLLQALAPEEAGALPAAAVPVDELLVLLRRRVGLRQATVTSLSELTARAGHAVCVPRAGPPVLLEVAASPGLFRLDLGGWAEPPLVRARALDGLFPCTVFYIAAQRSVDPERARPGTPLGATLRFLSQVLGLALPISMMLIIDKVVTQGAHNTLLVLLLGVALLTVFQILFNWVHAVHVARRIELIAHPERLADLRGVLASSASAELATPVWACMQGAVDDARWRTEIRSQFHADLAFLMLLVLLMAALDAVLLLVALAVLPACVAIEAWASRQTRHSGAAVAGLTGQLSRRYFELASAAELIHAANLGRYLVGQWRALDGELALARHRLSVRRRLASLTVEGLQKLSVLPVMLLGVGAVMEGGMTLGQYIAFNLLAMQLGQPVLRIAAWWRARSDQRLRGGARAELARRGREAVWPALGHRNAPADDHWLLSVQRLVCVTGAERALSFQLVSGGWLGIVGPSGCGKSTLLRVLAGLQAPLQGEVLIDGVPVHQLAPEARAGFLQLVPQTPVVFSGSIADNISLGDPAAPPEAVLAAASVCGVTEFAQRLPAHLNTIVGAAGRPLSGGEQQRLALARAVLPRPRLLLLDEASAGLDRISEAGLLARLREFLPGTAIILVTHRSSALRGCAQVLDLEAGIGDSAPLRAVAD